MRQRDRLHHLLLIGQTGTGKSTLIAQMAAQDVSSGQGFCLIDPHGDLSKALATKTSDHLHYWDVADPNSPFGYNPLTPVSEIRRPLVASGLIDTLRHQWADAWGPRMENLLRWSCLALLEQPSATIADIMPLLTKREFRREIVANVSDPECRRFWIEEFPALNYKGAIDGVAPISNKLGTFLAHPTLRKALTEPKRPLRLRQIMDKGQSLIINLSKGRLGAEAANVMGGLILTAIRNAAFTREDQPEAVREPFMVYVDEFPNFTSETLAESLSELRKYRIGFTLAGQHLSQATRAVREALFGNVGTIVGFRVGPEDASYLSRYFQVPTEKDLLNLPNHAAYCRLMIDGTQSRCFSLRTLPI